MIPPRKKGFSAGKRREFSMATLFIASGPKEGQWFPIKHKSLVVGRDEGLLAQIVAPGVSRKHFQISFDPVKDCYRLTDLGSKNGVILNNKPITEIVDLKSDDLIRVGEALLFFSTEDFNDDHNALKFYRLRGQRTVDTRTIKIPPR
jgi:pSer/pThr/pTyr-binding forkhead associated (FHA) protein